jgi:hypothetical protein
MGKPWMKRWMRSVRVGANGHLWTGSDPGCNFSQATARVALRMGTTDTRKSQDLLLWSFRERQFFEVLV